MTDNRITILDLIACVIVSLALFSASRNLMADDFAFCDVSTCVDIVASR